MELYLCQALITLLTTPIPHHTIAVSAMRTEFKTNRWFCNQWASDSAKRRKRPIKCATRHLLEG
jgi:multisubunit Na+/H+ antiporter MnhG subunit